MPVINAFKVVFPVAVFVYLVKDNKRLRGVFPGKFREEIRVFHQLTFIRDHVPIKIKAVRE